MRMRNYRDASPTIPPPSPINAQLNSCSLRDSVALTLTLTLINTVRQHRHVNRFINREASKLNLKELQPGPWFTVGGEIGDVYRRRIPELFINLIRLITTQNFNASTNSQAEGRF